MSRLLALALAVSCALTTPGTSARAQPPTDDDLPARIARLIADLNDDSFRVRERAMAELARLWEVAQPELRRATESSPHLEVRRRAKQLLEKGGALLRTAEVTDLVFTPDGRTLFFSTLDGLIFTWNVAGHKEVRRVPAGRRVYGLALSPDGKLLASASEDGRVRLWDAGTGKQVKELKSHEKAVVGIAFSPDGKLLAAGGYDGTIRLWDVTTGSQRQVFRGHEHRVTSVAFSPDGKTLASGGIVPKECAAIRGCTQADEVRLWDVGVGKELRRLSLRGDRVRFAPD
ncbi:MAG TPA: WD40 repeat domain-containing protein, partial [Gemmataceae bacterium]|nr:WD40 repeat domain-containing protein [Gemmataceae bacterium]